VKKDYLTLLTIKNFALKSKVTPSYIYKLIKEDRMQPVIIDGVQFIDVVKYPTIPK
jgi:hypothetical protein